MFRIYFFIFMFSDNKGKQTMRIKTIIKNDFIVFFSLFSKIKNYIIFYLKKWILHGNQIANFTIERLG